VPPIISRGVGFSDGINIDYYLVSGSGSCHFPLRNIAYIKEIKTAPNPAVVYIHVTASAFQCAQEFIHRAIPPPPPPVAPNIAITVSALVIAREGVAISLLSGDNSDELGGNKIIFLYTIRVILYH
jgi:hypothetical protein